MADSEGTTIEFTREELYEVLHNHTAALQQVGPSLTPGVSESISEKLAEASRLAASPGWNTSLESRVAVELSRPELFAVMLDHEFAKTLRPELHSSIGEKLREGEEQILAQEGRALKPELSGLEAARDQMRERHAREYENVHNGSGMSEESPSQLAARHRREENQLFAARDRREESREENQLEAEVLRQTPHRSLKL